MRRADRLFQIIQLLRRAGGPVTAAALAEELEVSIRSVYRDIADLCAQRVPIRGEAGIGYVLDRGFDLPPLMLTREEVEAAVLGAQWVIARGDPALAAAGRDLLAKIAAVVPDELQSFIAEPTTGAPPSLALVQDGVDLARVRAAIRQGRKMRIRYHDEQGRESRRTIWPTVIGYTDMFRLIAAGAKSAATSGIFVRIGSTRRSSWTNATGSGRPSCTDGGRRIGAGGERPR